MKHLPPSCIERVRLPGVVFRCAPERANSNAVAGFVEVLRQEVRAHPA